MGLTFKVEKRLEDAGLVAFFEQHRDRWRIAAIRARNYIVASYPAAAPIRQDDVAKALFTALEVDPVLADWLAEEKLKQKFWRIDFVDLIIDRLWNELGE